MTPRMHMIGGLLAACYAATPGLALSNRPTGDGGSMNSGRNAAGYREGSAGSGTKAQSASDVSQMLNGMSIDLPQMIRTAESRTQGKACSAKIVEWKCVQPQVGRNAGQPDRMGNDTLRNEPGSKQTDDTLSRGKAETTGSGNLSDTDPVAIIVCTANGKLTEVLVSGKSGKVMDTRDCSSYKPGSSAYLTAGSESVHGSRRYWHNMARRWSKASGLIGQEVVDTTDGQRIGEVKDLVVDPDAGRVMFVVASLEKAGANMLNAIPFSAMSISGDAKTVRISATRGQFTSASEFNRDNWPNMADESWVTKVFGAFHQEPYWLSERDEASGGRGEQVKMSNERGNAMRRWQKASDLMSKSVKNLQGEDLGSIKDMAIDVESGRIMYGVLSFGGILGLGDKLFAVPWSALNLAPDYKNFMLAVDKERLKNASGFDEDHWPNMADERWASETHDYYGQPRYWDPNRSVSRGNE